MKGIICSIFSLLLIITACDDDLNSVGLSTKPNSDNLYIHADTVYLSGDLATQDYTKTVQFDSIYFGSNTQRAFLLGNFNDPLFGSLKGDFLCQFYQNNFSSDSILDNKADSVVLTLLYSGWLGDSIAPMVARAYPVKKGANFTQEYHYTNIDLYNKYVSPSQQPWAVKSYTARDLSVHDSVYYDSDYKRNLTFNISTSGLDTLLIREWKRNPSTFQSILKFTDFFPGVYVTTSSGSGNILKVYDVYLSFYYTTVTKDANNVYVSKKDSIKMAYADDAILSSQYKNDNENLTTPDPNITYIKAPAGVYTQYTLPLQEIANKIANRQINSIKFAVTALPDGDWKYALKAPTTLMLIRKDSLTHFFSSTQAVSAPTGYQATYSNYQYNFNDISAMVKKGLAEGKTTLDVMLVPIYNATTSIYYNGNYYPYSLYTAYDITPSGVKLRKGNNADGYHYLRLEILSTDLSQR